MRADQRRDRPPLVWTVEDTLPEYGVGQLVGPAYSGKTYVAASLALALCNESVRQWFGRGITHHGDVVYVLMEGAWDFQRRVDAWLSAHPGCSDDRLFTLEEEEFSLANERSVLELVRDVEALDLAPALIVIDTQSLAAAGVDENDNSKMNAVFAALKWLSKRLGCVVLTVHHTGHSGDRARGASAQFAAVDVELRLQPGSITATKVKAFRPWEQPEGFEIVAAGESAYVAPAPLLASLAKSSASDQDVDLRQRVLEFVSVNPGVSLNKIAEEVKGNSDRRRRVVGDLVRDCLLVESTGERGARCFTLRPLPFADDRNA